MRHLLRLKISLVLVLALVIAGLFVHPAIAQAQAAVVTNQATTPEAANAPKYCTQPEVNAESQGPFITELGIHQNIHNWLGNLFTKGTLHYRLLCDPLIVGTIDKGTGQVTSTSVYQVAQSLVNFAVLIILLIIAFANILRIKLDTYAVKKAIPLLVFGVFMANIALPLIRTVVDFSGVLTATIISQSTNIGTKTEFTNKLISAVYTGGATTLGTTLTAFNGGGIVDWSGFFGLFGLASFAIAATGPFLIALLAIALILIFLPAFMFLFLGLLFIARIYVLVILTAVSPVAFASLGFEPLRARLWGWWWGQFIKWTFMVPATFFLFWLGIQFFNAVGAQMDIGTYIITLFLIGYATQIPLKMGGSILSQWNERLVKPIRTLAARPVTAGINYVRQAGPRDVTRFLSTPPTWLTRGRFGTLNAARVTREAMATIEASNARKEAASPAGQLGKNIGGTITRTGLLRAATGQGRGQAYQTASDINRVMPLLDQLLDKLGGRGVTDKQIQSDSQLKARYEKMMDEAKKSNNLDQSLAAYLLNSRIGHYMPSKEQAEVLAKFQQKGIDTSLIANRYANEYALRKGVPVGAAQPKQTSNQQFIEMFERYQAEVNSRTGDEQVSYLKKMLSVLKEIKNTKGDPDIKTMEEDGTLKAMGKIILQNQSILGSDRLIELLNDEKIRFNQYELADVVRNIDQVVNKINTASTGTVRIVAKDLEPLMSEQPITPQIFRELKPEGREALLGLFVDGLEEFKVGLERHLDSQFDGLQSGLVNDAERQRLKARVDLLFAKGQDDVTPTSLLASDVESSLDGSPAEKQQRAKQIIDALDVKSSYNTISKRLAEVKEII